MHNRKPLISIIIPTFNSEKTLEVCLRSIKKQRGVSVEIILVDEFSQDKTPQISKKYGSLFQVKGERSVARNYGFRKSKGDYVLFIDSDMELTPRVVSECVSVSSGEYAVVIPEITAGSGFWTACRVLERKCYIGDNMIEAARFFPRRIITKLHGYDEQMAGVEDWDLHQRLLSVGFSVKRINKHIIHHEGVLNVLNSMKKKMYYGQVFNQYRKRHPKAFRAAFVRTSFIKNWKILLRDPIHAAGIVIMKGLEGIALLAGMIQGGLYGYSR